MSGIPLEKFRAAIRDVPDFPTPGVIFKDITPILADPTLFGEAVDLLADEVEKLRPDKIVGIDARGFLFGAAVAYRLRRGFIPVRKKGKLPHRSISFAYQLEYGAAEMEMHVDAVSPGDRVVLVDDLLATGGTSAAAIHLVHQSGGVVEAALFFIELTFLQGRRRLADVPVRALVTF